MYEIGDEGSEKEDKWREKEKARERRSRDGLVGKEGERRARDRDILSSERVSVISKRDENTVCEKRGRQYIAKGKQHLKGEEGGDGTIHRT